MWLPERTSLGRMRSRLLAPLSGDVLEVGAGTGLNFSHYAPGVRVLALEPDPAMHERARRRAGSGVSVMQAGDAYMDGLAPGTFDAVVFSLVLCSVPDVAQTLARAMRVLRPGGTLAVLEHVRSQGLLGALQDRLTPLWQRTAGGCRLNRNIRRSIKRAGYIPLAAGSARIPGIIVRDLEVSLYRTPSSGQKP
jgi:SAM-dependent methyltransferase